MLQSIKKYLELISFSHSLFALPFAIITYLLVSQTNPINWSTFSLIIIAMICARSGAMGFNRLVDQKIDALNPRTSLRHSVTGIISKTSIVVMIIFFFAGFIFTAWKLNYQSFLLSPLAIFMLCFYSYTKRFTSFSHFFLGIAIGVTPIAVWIAVTGTISFISITLSLSMLTWIAGFDIIYALQDQLVDQEQGLFSIPACYGLQNSLYIAYFAHMITIFFWYLTAYLAQAGLFFYAGITIAAGILLKEHHIVKINCLEKINLVFFKMNTMVSFLLLIASTIDFIKKIPIF